MSAGAFDIARKVLHMGHNRSHNIVWRLYVLSQAPESAGSLPVQCRKNGNRKGVPFMEAWQPHVIWILFEFVSRCW